MTASPKYMYDQITPLTSVTLPPPSEYFHCDTVTLWHLGFSLLRLTHQYCCPKAAKPHCVTSAHSWNHDLSFGALALDLKACVDVLSQIWRDMLCNDLYSRLCVHIRNYVESLQSTCWNDKLLGFVTFYVVVFSHVRRCTCNQIPKISWLTLTSDHQSACKLLLMVQTAVR